MKTRLLEVVNGDEARYPVEYAAMVCGNGLADEVQKAVRELGLAEGRDPALGAEIYRALDAGDVYWVDETHCFCLVDACGAKTR